jgi:hypothetical protein
MATTTSNESGQYHAKKFYQPSSHSLHHDRNQVELLTEEIRRLRQQNLVLKTEVSTIKYVIRQTPSNLIL